ITVQFALIGLGILKDEASVKAMSRTGDPKEILRGPLYYGIIFVLMTLIFWKDSPIGIIALMLMCGGDGIADVVGRRVKSPKLPWSKEKSVAGSLAVFVGGWFLALFVLSIYGYAGVSGFSSTNFALPTAIIAFGVMLVESLPFKDVDNLTITIAAVILGGFFF
ncbi:MAG: phosphatidate cytidylyltransferase, partial [Chloroflexi bacterium]